MCLQRLTIDLPDGIAAQIRAAVEAGDYASASEAVQDAVQLWSERRSGTDRSVEDLRQAWDAGKASGTRGPLDLGELRKEARSRSSGRSLT